VAVSTNGVISLVVLFFHHFIPFLLISCILTICLLPIILYFIRSVASNRFI
jgi:hypothetical protein